TINNTDATVLAIGVGAPKQELWIAKHREQLKKIKIFLAIGATINFEAGKVKRSPKWMSEIGFEWLYRLLSEPKRLWKRYLLDALPFFTLILKQKLQLYKNPWFPTKKNTSTQLSIKKSFRRM
ncbi:MAG: WecB/TagA/CpsF family glycosyltransferase, partial [Cyanobacteria bacterium P01_A01_bin.45]